jgi:WD40 repeat protein
MIQFYDLRIGGLIGDDGISICRPYASTAITTCGRDGKKEGVKSCVTGLEYVAGGNILACTLSNNPAVYFYDIRKVAGPTPSISSKNKTASYLAAVNPGSIKSHKLEDEPPQTQRGNSWLTVSRDGSSMAVCSLNSCIYVYSSLTDLDAQAPTVFKDIPTSFFTKPCFSPDSQFLACGSLNSCIYIWDVNKPRQSQRLHGHNREVNSVRWSVGSSLFLTTCGDDECVLVWDYDLSKLLVCT